MPTLKRIQQIIKYGVGPGAEERKKAKKHAAREARFKTDLWQHGDEFATRNYRSYEEYTEHQRSKLGNIIGRLKEKEDDNFLDFQQCFRECAELKPTSTVLCLGARLGTEVRALHSLGHFAVGIDLNPGPDNAYVLPGDFHDVVFPDDSVDAIYTNALDHVFDLTKIVAEIERMLKPGGIFIADMIDGYEEGFLPGKYESMHWSSIQTFIDKLTELCDLEHVSLRALDHVGRGERWKQAVFRKPGASTA